MAASKKDMRRQDLIIPFVDSDDKNEKTDVSSSLASTMPMMAMFTRNRMIAWVAMTFSIQTWLSETPETAKTAQTPAYFSVLMSLLGIGTSYMGLFMPPPLPKGGSPAGAPPPAAASLPQ